MQAVGTAMLRTLTIPYIIRHDRGPEFGSAVMEEVCTLLGIDHRVPAPHRPQEVGLGETIHREVNKQVGLILHELSTSFPQEWAKALDLVLRHDDLAPSGQRVLRQGPGPLLVHEGPP